MRLMGVFEKDKKEMFLIEEKGNFFVKEKNSINVVFENYELIANRDKVIGLPPAEGEGVFNFRYGPVTSGVREAGIFNIYTYGERIISINIDPSYKHRGAESAMAGKNPFYGLQIAENICSNFTVSHSLAFLRALRSAAGVDISQDRKVLEAVLLELERLYNHIHVFSRLAKGAAQNVLHSHLSWIYEELLRINEKLCGNRFLKQCIGIDNVKLNRSELKTIIGNLAIIKEKFTELYEHALRSYNFIDRIYKTAPLSKENALKIGLTGPSLRASGVEFDLRTTEKVYKNFKISLQQEGDALARLNVRCQEFKYSLDFIINNLENIQKEEFNESHIELENGEGIGYAESPGGLVVYYLVLKDGKIDFVYISPPSVFGFRAFCESFIGFIFTDFSFAFDSFGINFADCAR